MRLIASTYVGEWMHDDSPFIPLQHCVCEVTIHSQTFVYLVPTHLVDDFKYDLVDGNWFGDEFPDFGPDFEGSPEDYFDLVGIQLKISDLVWTGTTIQVPQ